MSAREWELGDVAMVVNVAGEEKVARFSTNLVGGPRWIFADGSSLSVREVTCARPLAVIDPGATKGGALLPGWLRHHASRIASESAGGRASVADDMRYIADQIEAALAPKPDEPADPRARVTDRRDNIWRLLADGDWVCTSGPDIGEYIAWSRLAEERGPLSIEVIA